MSNRRIVTRDRYLTPKEAAEYREQIKVAEEVVREVLARRKAASETGGLPEASGPGSVYDLVELNRFVAALRQAREAQGLSLADLSERTGIDRSALSKLENRKNLNPTFATLARYADAVGQRITLGLTSAEPLRPQHGQIATRD